MLRLHNIKLPLSYHSKSLIQAAAKALGRFAKRCRAL